MMGLITGAQLAHWAEVQLIIAGRPDFIKDEYLEYLDEMDAKDDIVEMDLYMYLQLEFRLSTERAKITVGYWIETKTCKEHR